MDQEHGPDLLDDSAGFVEWLDMRGLDGGPAISAAELALARELREALRALLLANHGAETPSEALAVVEAAGVRAGLSVRLPGDGAALVPVSGGVPGALGTVVAAAIVAMWDGTWRRLKACPRANCGWAFFDRSTNASATWCSMSICGGREKANAYYRRTRRSNRAENDSPGAIDGGA